MEKGNIRGESYSKKATYIIWHYLASYIILPDYSEGEDERSMESHMSGIQKVQQLLKEKQDKFQINKLMKITFSHPRRLLVTEFVTV